jgi:hypothetical protein
MVDLVAGAPVPPRLGEYERGLRSFRYAADLFTHEGD